MTLYSKTFDIESFRPFEISRHCSRAFEFIIIDEELGTSLISKPKTFFFFLGEGGGGGVPRRHLRGEITHFVTNYFTNCTTKFLLATKSRHLISFTAEVIACFSILCKAHFRHKIPSL